MKLIFSLIALPLIIQSCSNGTSKQILHNHLKGNTIRTSDVNRKIFVDSIFDAQKNINQVIDYYDQFEKVKKIVFYKKGEKDSTMVEYYANGNLRTKRYYWNGKECFERIDFNEKGKISQYVFLNSSQTSLYVRVYDSVGNFVAEKGKPFFESFILANGKFEFSTRDTVTALFFAPNPPDCKVKLFTVYDNQEIENIQAIKEPFIFRVKIYPLNKGTFEWPIRMKVYHKEKDSLIFSSNLQFINFQVK